MKLQLSDDCHRERVVVCDNKITFSWIDRLSNELGKVIEFRISNTCFESLKLIEEQNRKQTCKYLFVITMLIKRLER